MENTVIGNRIREFAIARGCMSYRALAKRSGLPRTVARYLWYKPWSKPQRGTVEKICGAFKVQENSFLIYAKELERT